MAIISLLLLNINLVYSLPDFSNYTDLTTRKQKFIEYLLPLAKSTNAKVLQDREKLLAIKKQNANSLGYFNLHWVQDKCQEYQVTPCDLNKNTTWNELLTKVDAIPPSLILAQGATESGWGTSRFAQEGNNLFGQWCFSSKCTIIAHHNNSKSPYGLRNFDSPKEAVHAYFANINAGRSYAKLREIRSQLHTQHKPLKGTILANGLINYSTRRQDYIDQIKQVITNNRLNSYDV